MKILGNEIKPGMILNHDNDQWEVIKTQHVKPGKGGAFNQVELKSINKNTKRKERFRSSDNVERVVLEDKTFNSVLADRAESVTFSGSIRKQDSGYLVDMLVIRETKKPRSTRQLNTSLHMKTGELVDVGGVNNDIFRVVLE